MTRRARLRGTRGTRRLARRAGFEEASRRGSHVKMRHADGRMAIVPDHRQIARGTLRSVLRQAGLTAEQFEQLL